ncbi:MAG: NYN domain-containing protein [Dehalococcoidia bacterium]|nr:NYN domain-containing protein [Dehalococcoidia bacterium]
MQNTSAETRSTRIAMLIDGDNAQPTLLGEMIAEAGKYGLVTIRRIYGDWTTTNMNSWKEGLNIHAIQPIQQFRYTIGKNATDSSMIIDAMDILHEGYVDGFCLVSSDSDYTRLATRIRERGLFVMGIGVQTTPKAFVNACEVFVYTENLRSSENAQSSNLPTKRKTAVEEPGPLPLLKKAVDTSLQEDGWAFLGVVGNRLHQLDPAFDPRTYGYKQLSQLIKSYQSEFHIKEHKSKSGTSTIYIRPIG